MYSDMYSYMYSYIYIYMSAVGYVQSKQGQQTSQPTAVHVADVNYKSATCTQFLLNKKSSSLYKL